MTTQDHPRPHGDALRAFSIDETCKRLGICRSTFYAMLDRGDVRPVRVGTYWRVPERELRRLLGEEAP